MGREQRVNSAIEAAELERTIGPVRAFEEVQECQKCALPRPNFVFQFCVGESLSSRGDVCAGRIFGEHLHVGCPRCNYAFAERCKDYTPETNGEVKP